MQSFHKLDMASTEWLTTHFLAKSSSRIRDLVSLSIPAGARVLDLCCGPGLYIPLILDLVGPTGHVTGLDQDPISLDAAHQRLSALPQKNWRLQHSSLEDYVAALHDYDFVLLFNCIGYFADPCSVIASIAQNLRPGATIVVKDFDLESFFFQPRDASMWAKLITAAKAKNDGNNPVSFNNFFGRKVHTLYHSSRFRGHSSDTWSQLMTHPFNSFETEYLWRNVECLLNQAGADCPADAADYFKQMFYPPSPTFFADPEAIFVEVEYITRLML